ncbi:bifunctional diaminohydroxyphosphoribosylaminopyrimidine deaminase/5-amino-6-(5-phosphoribosylamino)uracil reductase RibD [Chitiniphilus purpureus]|uniref:Riboflavin biosynthesis protein RibD n=1 Tax=Chitiniphilus purpureus TaxID=2981137 RepID=A0ABY6DZ86_9NEIS|nr:bifunctional diaminohydroxyphosphoribosylaminopyrimidine deaminase/5-amino-6-(5-phosphoribosylamino)uracil reductase RibD [Chitiniphilus sp. CD1]UXY17158.1 bifunctional diaminohydroxyphosphoribosylaminopyrimidine deaminase/5-amino-6-(5-phosphoribosylamino)uracil reductase RibD [Chitiniphilus sp. CD1]
MTPANDQAFMQRALALAGRGACNTTPNPSVGCVLVRHGVIVGEGYSQPVGQAHAEVMALREAGAAARGATAYVTLEPCSHYGRTPPCADALIAAGVTRVVAALTDPNPLVAGQGLARLAAAGVAVESGVLRAVALEHHKGFLSRMLRARPWLRIKLAASLDGRVALKDGQSQWITGQAAREDVQRLRARSCAMLTGIGTVLADDPQLTVRLPQPEPWHGRQPLRVVLDSGLRLPTTARLLAQPGVLVVGMRDGPNRVALEAAGAEVLLLPAAGQGRVDLAALLAELGRRGMNEVTVEAGGTLAGALLQAGLVDEVVLYQAPVLLGQGMPMAEFSLDRLADRLVPTVLSRRLVGADERIVLRFTQVDSLCKESP